MKRPIEQARAVLSLLKSDHGRFASLGSEPSVLALGAELLHLGEYRLVLDLCQELDREQAGQAEQLDCSLLTAEALLCIGQIRAALDVIERIFVSDGLSANQADRALVLKGRALWRAMKFREAKLLLEQLRSRLVVAPDSPLLGWCTFFLGNSLWSLGEMDEARKAFTESLVSAYRANDTQLEALAANALGIMRRSLCHWNEAAEYLSRSQDLWKSVGNRPQVAHAMRSLALVDLKRGRVAAAHSRALEAERIAAELGHEESRCFALEVSALAKIHAGEPESALEFLRRVYESPNSHETARPYLLAVEFEGDVRIEQNRPTEALAAYEDALTRALALAPRGDIVAELRRRRAECFHLLDRHDEAYAEAMLGLQHTRELGDRYEEAATYRIAALAAAALGRPDEAKQLFEQGFALFEDIETPYEWGKLWMAFGDWLASDRSGAFHDARMAVEAYHAAHYRFETMGAKAKLAEVNARIARATPSPDALDAAAAPRPARSPRPRPSRSREADVRSEWARERFGVITMNPAMFDLLTTVEKLARSRASVLVLGESGTGKELIAHALHQLSGRIGEFVAINCATLPKDVIESELFGHVAGAFTGAAREKVGLLEVCEGGTVFLDEISEMSYELQARLLRFLESGEIRRVGATKVKKISTRVVAASNRDEADLRAGRGFREDLYFRLAQPSVHLPPLRLRGARDIELLAEHFLAVHCAEEQKSMSISEAAHQKLARYAWPGNIRELRSTMSQRAVLNSDGDEIRPEDLRLDSDPNSNPTTLGEELAVTERRRIEEALRASRNSKADAARLLGIPRTTLLNRMTRLGIESA